MKRLLLYIVSSRLIFLFFITLSSCGTNEMNNDSVASDDSTGFITKRDTAMPHEPVSADVSKADSVTPNARNTTKDSIGSKISIHHGKVKIVDTTKKDK